MSNGLEDVVAAETSLSEVDGAAGRLIIRGRSLDDLAGRSTAEEVFALLLEGLFEAPVPAAAFRCELGQARAKVFAMVEREAALPPVDAARAWLARLADGESFAHAATLIAAPAVFVPAVIRLQQGLAPLPPDPDLGHAADVLRMLHGAAPGTAAAAALDAYLVTVSDHGLNASTFAARVVASTGAGLTSAMLAAISALKGPLHGGAPGPVLDMLDAIGTPAEAAPWLAAALDRGERLMGFGHRIYRVRDPRADALKAALAEYGSPRLALAEAVEAAALALLRQRKPGRSLDTNVEFYTALLLEALGFPRNAFTGVFAMGRAAGWIAHAREQAMSGRLIRPQSRYIGPRPPLAA